MGPDKDHGARQKSPRAGVTSAVSARDGAPWPVRRPFEDLAGQFEPSAQHPELVMKSDRDEVRRDEVDQQRAGGAAQAAPSGEGPRGSRGLRRAGYPHRLRKEHGERVSRKRVARPAANGTRVGLTAKTTPDKSYGSRRGAQPRSIVPSTAGNCVELPGTAPTPPQDRRVCAGQRRCGVLVHTEEVTGSIPVSPAAYFRS
jgi:hypothetical protein